MNIIFFNKSQPEKLEICLISSKVPICDKAVVTYNTNLILRNTKHEHMDNYISRTYVNISNKYFCVCYWGISQGKCLRDVFMVKYYLQTQGNILFYCSWRGEKKGRTHLIKIIAYY